MNGWLIPSLESGGPEYVNVYLGRLGASHVFEVAKFLHNSERRVPQVRVFLDGLEGEARAAYKRVKAVGWRGPSRSRASLSMRVITSSTTRS